MLDANFICLIIKDILSTFEKFFLYQRSIVETVIDQLKSICHIEHTRHRSPINFLVNLVSGLAGYCLKPKKPSIGRSKFWANPQALNHNRTIHCGSRKKPFIEIFKHLFITFASSIYLTPFGLICI